MIMIANTGADAKGWWWYYNDTPTDIGNAINANNARLINLTPAGNGRFNAVMESCQGGCPGWWWYFGIDDKGVLDLATDNGARVNTAASYACGSGKCFVTTMIANTPNDVVSCDASGCISQAKLAQNICGTLAGKVVGYACEVGQVRPGYGGQARTATDGALAMMPHLVTNIASVSKTITAVAVIKMLASKGLTVDTKISPYIYSEWSQGQNIGQLTFRHSADAHVRPGAGGQLRRQYQLCRPQEHDRGGRQRGEHRPTQIWQLQLRADPRADAGVERGIAPARRRSACLAKRERLHRLRQRECAAAGRRVDERVQTAVGHE